MIPHILASFSDHVTGDWSMTIPSRSLANRYFGWCAHSLQPLHLWCNCDHVFSQAAQLRGLLA